MPPVLGEAWIAEVRRALADHETGRAERLVEQALHLRMYGERAPGAPTDPTAETWAEWERRAQAWAREGL